MTQTAVSPALGSDQPKACARDLELWFSTAPADVAKAQRICLTECPAHVRAACLRLALENEGRANSAWRFGVFGGRTPRERWRIAVGRPKKGRPARAATRPDAAPTLAPEALCTVPGCTNPRSGPYCAGHRSRLGRHGDVLADIPLRPRRSSKGATAA